MRSVTAGSMHIAEYPNVIMVQHEDGSPIMVYEMDELHEVMLAVLDNEIPEGAAEALAKLEHLSLLKAARDRRVKLDRANHLLMKLVRGEQLNLMEIIKHLEGGAP